MGRLFAENKINVPPSPIVDNGDPMPYMLIADEAFQLTNYKVLINETIPR